MSTSDVVVLTALTVEPQATVFAHLLGQSQQGDAEAFGEICRALETRLFRQAVSLCGDAALAEDLAQETMVEAWKCLSRFNGQCQFFTWLCAILLNRYRNLVRRRRPTVFAVLSGAERQGINDALGNLVDPQFQPDQTAEQNEKTAWLRELVDRLPAKHREVIYLRFFVDDTLDGIAGALGCSVGTVKSRLFHALEKLRLLSQREPSPNKV